MSDAVDTRLYSCSSLSPPPQTYSHLPVQQWKLHRLLRSNTQGLLCLLFFSHPPKSNHGQILWAPPSIISSIQPPFITASTFLQPHSFLICLSHQALAGLYFHLFASAGGPLHTEVRSCHISAQKWPPLYGSWISLSSQLSTPPTALSSPASALLLLLRHGGTGLQPQHFDLVIPSPWNPLPLELMSNSFPSLMVLLRLQPE